MAPIMDCAPPPRPWRCAIHLRALVVNCVFPAASSHTSACKAILVHRKNVPRVYPIVGALYFIMCWPLSLLSQYLEKRIDARMGVARRM